MRVLFRDAVTGRYHRSEVYAYIFSGQWRYLVLEPALEGGLLKFVDYMDVPPNGARWIINVRIIMPEHSKDWVFIDDALETSERFGLRTPAKSFYGYSWLFENPDALNRLLEGEVVAFREAYPGREPVRSELEGWTYVRSAEDAKSLIRKAHEFHDSVLTGLNYVSGSYGDESGLNVTDDVRRVEMRFDCSWSPNIELVFEGVTALNLRPAMDNYTSEISSAAVYASDSEVLFSDWWFKEGEKPDDDATWIRAMDLRWRFTSPKARVAEPAKTLDGVEGA